MYVIKVNLLFLVLQILLVSSRKIIVPLESEDSNLLDNGPTNEKVNSNTDIKEDVSSPNNEFSREENQEVEPTTSEAVNTSSLTYKDASVETVSNKLTISGPFNSSSTPEQTTTASTTALYSVDIPSTTSASTNHQTSHETPSAVTPSSTNKTESINDNVLTTSSSVFSLNGLDSLGSAGKSSVEKNIKSVKAIPPVLSDLGKDEDSIQIPMTCISDYVEYCQTRFSGFRFQDGCRYCRCQNRSKDFCDKGPCQFYATSFEHAITYCIDVLAQNAKNYKIQLRQRKLRMENDEKKIKELLPSVKIDKNVTNVKPDFTTVKSMEKKTIKKVDSEKKMQTSMPILTKDILINGVTTNSVNIENKKNKYEKNTKTQPVKVDKVKTLTIVTLKNTLNNKERNIKNSTFSGSAYGNQSHTIEKNKNTNHIGKKINPIKSSLERISDKKMLRNIIYCIAHNELGIQRIEKKMIDYPDEDIATKLFIKRLKIIKEKNMAFKSKILEIVKLKLKQNKSRHNRFDDEFNPVFFKRMVKECNRNNEEVHEMKGGVKLWFRRFKRVKIHNKYRSGASRGLPTAFVMVLLSTVTMFL